MIHIYIHDSSKHLQNRYTYSLYIFLNVLYNLGTQSSKNYWVYINKNRKTYIYTSLK